MAELGVAGNKRASLCLLHLQLELAGIGGLSVFVLLCTEERK